MNVAASGLTSFLPTTILRLLAESDEVEDRRTSETVMSLPTSPNSLPPISSPGAETSSPTITVTQASASFSQLPSSTLPPPTTTSASSAAPSTQSSTTLNPSEQAPEREGSVILPPQAQQFRTVVMFVDVAKFSFITAKLAEKGPLGVEELGFYLNRTMERLVEIITRNGGDIFKFAGDAMMVIWPLPEAEANETKDFGRTTTMSSTMGGHGRAFSMMSRQMTVAALELLRVDSHSEHDGLIPLSARRFDLIGEITAADEDAVSESSTSTDGGGFAHDPEITPHEIESLHHALRAAIEVQAELNEATLSDEVSFNVKIGIGLGPTAILHVGGIFNRLEFLLSGPALLSAFRAEEQCSPGETVISSHLYELVKDSFYGYQHGSRFTQVLGAREDHQRQVPPPPVAKLPPYVSELKLNQYVPAAIRPFAALKEELWSTELREVSVLFANLGFEASQLQRVTEDSQDDEALDHVQQVISVVQSAVYQFEGSLNKFLIDDKGSTLIAAFGLPPVVHTNDPTRAVHCALLMRQRLREMGLSVTIGITTGTALCGLIGSRIRREYSLLGDVVNMAARLMQAANGSILCDTATRLAVMSEPTCDVRFEQLPPLKVKGKDNKLLVFNPYRDPHQVSCLATKVQAHLLDALQAPSTLKEALPGRGPMLLRLRDMVLRTLNPGGATHDCIVIKGNRGIGKSTILRFLSQLIRQYDHVGGKDSGAAPKIVHMTAAPLARGFRTWRGLFSKLCLLPRPGEDTSDAVSTKSEGSDAVASAKRKGVLVDDDAVPPLLRHATVGSLRRIFDKTNEIAQEGETHLSLMTSKLMRIDEAEAYHFLDEQEKTIPRLREMLGPELWSRVAVLDRYLFTNFGGNAAHGRQTSVTYDPALGLQHTSPKTSPVNHALTHGDSGSSSSSHHLPPIIRPSGGKPLLSPMASPLPNPLAARGLAALDRLPQTDSPTPPLSPKSPLSPILRQRTASLSSGTGSLVHASSRAPSGPNRLAPVRPPGSPSQKTLPASLRMKRLRIQTGKPAPLKTINVVDSPRSLPETMEVEEDTDNAFQSIAFDLMYTVLRKSGPLVVLIDEAEHMSPLDWTFTRYVLQRLEKERANPVSDGDTPADLCIVLTTLDLSLSINKPRFKAVPTEYEEILARPSTHREHVSPLQRRGLRDMLKRIWNCRRIEPLLVDVFMEKTWGIPLHIETFADVLTSFGFLQIDENADMARLRHLSKPMLPEDAMVQAGLTIPSEPVEDPPSNKHDSLNVAGADEYDHLASLRSLPDKKDSLVMAHTGACEFFRTVLPVSFRSSRCIMALVDRLTLRQQFTLKIAAMLCVAKRGIDGEEAWVADDPDSDAEEAFDDEIKRHENERDEEHELMRRLMTAAEFGGSDGAGKLKGQQQKKKKNNNKLPGIRHNNLHWDGTWFSIGALRLVHPFEPTEEEMAEDLEALSEVGFIAVRNDPYMSLSDVKEADVSVDPRRASVLPADDSHFDEERHGFEPMMISISPDDGKHATDRRTSQPRQSGGFLRVEDAMRGRKGSMLSATSRTTLASLGNNDPDSVDMRCYRFRFSMLQDTLYGTLSHEQRRRLHTSVSEKLREIIGDGEVDERDELAVEHHERLARVHTKRYFGSDRLPINTLSADSMVEIDSLVLAERISMPDADAMSRKTSERSMIDHDEGSSPLASRSEGPEFRSGIFHESQVFRESGDHPSGLLAPNRTRTSQSSRRSRNSSVRSSRESGALLLMHGSKSIESIASHAPKRQSSPRGSRGTGTSASSRASGGNRRAGEMQAVKVAPDVPEMDVQDGTRSWRPRRNNPQFRDQPRVSVVGGDVSVVSGSKEDKEVDQHGEFGAVVPAAGPITVKAGSQKQLEMKLVPMYAWQGHPKSDDEDGEQQGDGVVQEVGGSAAHEVKSDAGAWTKLRRFLAKLCKCSKRKLPTRDSKRRSTVRFVVGDEESRKRMEKQMRVDHARRQQLVRMQSLEVDERQKQQQHLLAAARDLDYVCRTIRLANRHLMRSSVKHGRKKLGTDADNRVVFRVVEVLRSRRIFPLKKVVVGDEADGDEPIDAAAAVAAVLMTQSRTHRNSDAARTLSYTTDLTACLLDLVSWDFDVFRLAELTRGNPLVYVGHTVMHSLRLPERFDLPFSVLINFLKATEFALRGAGHAYHNNLRAADTLQVVFFLLRMSGTTEFVSKLELLALVLAVVAQDFAHTGLSDRYAVNSGALKYPDFLVDTVRRTSGDGDRDGDDAGSSASGDVRTRSFHKRLQSPDDYSSTKAFSLDCFWRFLSDHPSADLVSCVRDRSERKRLRSMVAEFVLSSERRLSRRVLRSFDMRVLRAATITKQNRRVLLLLFLRCASESFTMRPFDLYRTWIERFREESFVQGDRQAALGHHVDEGMDRADMMQAQLAVRRYTETTAMPFFDALASFSEALSKHYVPHLKHNYKALLQSISTAHRHATARSGSPTHQS